MHSILKNLSFLIAFVMIQLPAFAQNQGSKSLGTRFSIEVDPATFLFNGYSAHLRIQPRNSAHLLVGGGLYAMDLPTVLVDLNKNNRDKGWDIRIHRGIGLFGEYHFTEVNRKLLLGAQLSTQQFKIENEMFSGSEKFTNTLLMGYGGYSFRPFSFPLYVKAWGGLGYTHKISGEHTLGEQTYDIAPLTVFATVHVGYTF